MTPDDLDTARLAVDAARRFDENALPTLVEYTRIPCLSPSFDVAWEEHGHLRAATSLLAEWAAGRGIDGLSVEVHELAGRTPVIRCEIAPSPEAEDAGTVLVYGHLDKQPPMGAWRRGLGPFDPVIDGDRLYGRGTADDGYAIFAALSAIEAGVSAGGAHARCVVLVEASEESGSSDLPAHLEALAPRIGEPSLVVCLDSGCATYDRLWVTTSLRGMLLARIEVEVLGEGVHSGSAGGVVPSSFRILRQLISRVEDESTGEILLPELRVEIPAGRLAEIEAVTAEMGDDAAGRFPTIDGLRLMGDSPAERLANRTWRPALALIGIDGVPPTGEAGNVLRPSTAAKLAIRIPPTCDAGTALEALRQAFTTDVPHGARVSFEGEPSDGWDAPATEDWLAAATDEASLAYFGRSVRATGEGGTIPFMGDLGRRFPDAQFLATGVLGPESNAHGPNEFLHLPTARPITAAVAHVLDVHARRPL